MEQVSWRYIFWMLTSLGTFASVFVLGMMFWMTGRIDQTEQERTRDLLALSLEEKIDKLTLAVEDYAYWTLAYELVRDGDAVGVFENLGSGATDGALFDQIFILDSAGHSLHAFDEYAGANAHEAYDADALAPVLSELAAQTAQDYVSVSSVIKSNQQYFLVAAAWITPDNVASFPDLDYPVFVGVTKLDQGWQSNLVRKTRVRDLRFVDYSPEAGKTLPVLTDATGQPVVALTWDTLYTGTRLRREVLPALILLCLGLLGICGSAARYFHAQHKSLERANEVAIHDQLTGLLNRAGLEALLRQKHVARELANGRLATIFVDLNKFKQLNDEHGHNAGDIALKVTAERLQKSVRKTDYVARLGGDEFLCVVLDPDPEVSATSVAERFVSLAQSPISLGDHEERVEASVGVSVAHPGTQWETLLSQSDAAMYWSKKKNATRPVLFCKTMDGAQMPA